MGCSGILLSGGASSRMGRDKAALVLSSGESLGRHTASLMAQVLDPLIEVGVASSPAPIQIADDRREGPLVALAMAVGNRILTGQLRPAVLCAVDLPRLEAATLDWLCSIKPLSASVIPLVQGRPQYLLARYSVTAQIAALVAVRQGQRAMRSIGSCGRVKSPDETEIPPELIGSFADVDTPEQWTRIVGSALIVGSDGGF